jgi:hypothetical protein
VIVRERSYLWITGFALFDKAQNAVYEACRTREEQIEIETCGLPLMATGCALGLRRALFPRIRHTSTVMRVVALFKAVGSRR